MSLFLHTIPPCRERESRRKINKGVLDMKNMDQRVSVRLPEKIAQALDKYCEDNYLDRSTAIRMALINWEPLKKYLKKQ
jgi:hypothetical protein